jgi:DNA polymerase III alpha subunit
MIPLFKSHFSIGKSILTLADPEKQKEDGPDSIVCMALDNSLKEIFLVEDSLTGFLTAYKSCLKHKISLKFGLRITVCNNYESIAGSSHKIILFALNDNGFKQINKIFTFTNTEKDGAISGADLSSRLTSDIHVAIPFYDSYIWNNWHKFSTCVPDFLNQIGGHTYFWEDNELPFDRHMKDRVSTFCSDGKRVQMVKTKSIYYKNRDDYNAWVTYKIACNRNMGKFQTLSSPDLSYCGSKEFCFESWKENR